MLSNSTTVSFSMMTRAKAFFELLKFRLSFLVAFSGAIGYLLASGRAINWNSLVFFALGGFLVTGSANIINQIIETDLDKLMSRTMNRPLPTGKISSVEATLFSFLLGGVGLYLLLIYTNIPTTLLTLMSSILYGFVYTPLKRKGPIAVFVGAIPGALPPLIGWCAAAGNITYEALLIFGIQFIWQFPHFWAIAWVLDDDYKKAGFKLLPANGAKDVNTAFQLMIYSLCLIPLGLFPYMVGMTGKISAIITTLCGVLFLMQNIYLMKKCSREAAMQLMFGSFVYLPVVQIALVFDKIP
ncbi:MAG: protoheme farnesyltransferase [Bacteroidota bacterium]|jgi:protoheme IX farnesyltransferase